MPQPLWLTYAWSDNEGGDFDRLVARLEESGIDVVFDRIQLIPGRRLWEQIADRITSGDLSGWGYFLTPASLESQACREELAYALDRALGSQGPEFPLIGLLHGVPISEVPAALRIRLCVDLADPDWVESVVSSVEGRPRQLPASDPGRIRLEFHPQYDAATGQSAFEFRPRLGQVTYWRVAFPPGLLDASVGSGPAGGGGVGGSMNNYLDGTVTIDGESMRFVGSGDRLTAGTSAYLIYSGHPPAKICFGESQQPFAMLGEWITWNVGTDDS